MKLLRFLTRGRHLLRLWKALDSIELILQLGLFGQRGDLLLGGGVAERKEWLGSEPRGLKEPGQLARRGGVSSGPGLVDGILFCSEL